MLSGEISAARSNTMNTKRLLLLKLIFKYFFIHQILNNPLRFHLFIIFIISKQQNKTKMKKKFEDSHSKMSNMSMVPAPRIKL